MEWKTEKQQKKPETKTERFIHMKTRKKNSTNLLLIEKGLTN